jgi:hypothetical protein
VHTGAAGALSHGAAIDVRDGDASSGFEEGMSCAEVACESTGLCVGCRAEPIAMTRVFEEMTKDADDETFVGEVDGLDKLGPLDTFDAEPIDKSVIISCSDTSAVTIGGGLVLGTLNGIVDFLKISMLISILASKIPDDVSVTEVKRNVKHPKT